DPRGRLDARAQRAGPRVPQAGLWRRAATGSCTSLSTGGNARSLWRSLWPAARRARLDLEGRRAGARGGLAELVRLAVCRRATRGDAPPRCRGCDDRDERTHPPHALTRTTKIGAGRPTGITSVPTPRAPSPSAQA